MIGLGKSSIEKAFRNIKAITTRYYSTGYFRIVVFPHDPNPFGQLSFAVEIAKALGMNCEVAYYTTTVIQIKRGRVIIFSLVDLSCVEV